MERPPSNWAERGLRFLSRVGLDLLTRINHICVWGQSYFSKVVCDIYLLEIADNQGKAVTTGFHPELECFYGAENSSGPDQWVGMFFLGARASQDHLAGFPS